MADDRWGVLVVGGTPGWADQQLGGRVILFAAIMMIMVGCFQAFEGLVAILNDTFYVATRNYVFQFDATTWGWIHLILGLVVALAGWGLLSGRTWARVVGITVAVLSAIANFLWLPWYPFWALTVITLDVFVIWGPVRPRRWVAGRRGLTGCRRRARRGPSQAALEIEGLAKLLDRGACIPARGLLCVRRGWPSCQRSVQNLPVSTPRKLGQVVRDEPPVAPGEAKVPTGCSTTGPSEAAMLAGLELTRRSHDTADLLLRISSSTCRLEKQPTPP